MKFVTKKLYHRTLAMLVGLLFAPATLAAVNVAFFLEWATPNQVAKVEKAYDDAIGERVNWTNFDAGTEMTEAMLAGDIDISYSQGLAPFVTGIKANAPIKMVSIAVAYPANDCFVRNGIGISNANANELEGEAVAVPLNTMADYSFRGQMKALGVDVSKIQIIDQVPADAVVSLADGNVAMACIFGGNSSAKAREVAKPLMSNAEKAKADIVSFDVVSVTEKFAQENPDALRAFLEVTHEANADFARSQSKIGIIARDAGMSVSGARQQMSEFVFPTPAEQLSDYFNSGGLAEQAFRSLGVGRTGYRAAVDTSFLR